MTVHYLLDTLIYIAYYVSSVERDGGNVMKRAIEIRAKYWHLQFDVFEGRLQINDLGYQKYLRAAKILSNRGLP